MYGAASEFWSVTMIYSFGRFLTDLGVRRVSIINGFWFNWYVLQIPLGVILAIPPFNYPVNLAVSKIAPALIAGNSLMLKPPTQVGFLKIISWFRFYLWYYFTYLLTEPENDQEALYLSTRGHMHTRCVYNTNMYGELSHSMFCASSSFIYMWIKVVANGRSYQKI